MEHLGRVWTSLVFVAGVSFVVRVLFCVDSSRDLIVDFGVTTRRPARPRAMPDISRSDRC